LCLGRRLQPAAVFAGYLAAFAGIILAIFVWRLFPVSIGTAGPGLTALKQTGDYLTSVILMGAMALLWRRREEFNPEVLRLLLGAIALAVGSELALTFFAQVSHQADVVGHLLKIFSLYLIYKALIETELRRPYHLLFRNLRLSEAMVRQEREFADSLMETAQVIVLVLDRQGRIVRLNHACERLTGYGLAQVQGRLFWEVFPAPEEVEEVKEAFAHLTSGDFPQAYERAWLAKDGRRHLIAWSSTALSGEDGTVERVIGTGIDITDRREAENRLHRLNAALGSQIQAAPEQIREPEVIKGELDRFTYAVSHELGSLLRWISGYCRALEENCALRLDFRGRRYLRRLHEAIRQTRELIDALVHHSRMATAAIRRQEIDLSVQARAIVEDLQRAAPARRVEFSIEPGLTAAGDPAMLRAVLANLLGNAWKFTEKVSLGKIEFGALPATDDCWGFLIRDNRAGCTLNGGRHRLRAFERQQTIRDFSGAGVGLAMVQRIIQRHGGRVWAEIDHTQGTTVYFTLPKGGQASAAEPAGEDQPNSSTG
ncbi:MAG: MASE3 domain-containing protein, partial [Desulfobaccales bacterium]